jgi:uncharacterized small protein (DUF1192 family)
MEKTIQREQVLCDIILERDAMILALSQQVKNLDDLAKARAAEIEKLKAEIEALKAPKTGAETLPK